MIRKSTKEDILSLKKIWSSCFEDTNDYIEFFFNSCPFSDSCYVYLVGEKIVAMLFMFPIKICKGETLYNGSYIYSAATLPAYRNKGIMRDLLEYCYNLELNNGGQFTILLPSNENLYGFYKKLGYETSFFYSNKEIKITKNNNIQIEKLIFDDFYNLRLNLIKKDFMLAFWDKKMLKYILNEWLISGGQAYKILDGYALCTRNNTQVFVNEIYSKSKNCIDILSAIANIYDTDELTINSSLFEGYKGKKIKSCMLKTNNDDLLLYNDGYANLMLD